jgi:hypothetical protein
MIMVDDLDPYQVLKVAPDAGPQEVRRAFHQAVLRCHPDCYGGDTEQAKRRYSQVVAAYRRLRTTLSLQRPDNPPDTPGSDQFDPADFAWLALGEELMGSRGTSSPSKLEWLPRVVQEKVTEPVVNEPAAVVICWIAAIVLALAAGAITAALLVGPRGIDERATIISVAVTLGTYFVLLALSLIVIVAGRKTSWLMRVIGFRRQHALPKAPPGRKLPGNPS